jgi:DNA-binding GntR family transcriptional regulator
MDTRPKVTALAERRLAVGPLEPVPSFADRAYDAIRAGIAAMNIYEGSEPVRLDERELSRNLGISRTPIREAIARLEHEGLVYSVPRRGVFVARKSKAEIIEMVHAWAALESMAARLITEHATDAEIASLRAFVSDFDGGRVRARIDEYSEANIRFHQRILELSRSPLLVRLADTILVHVRSIRHRTIGEDERATRSVIDHMQIIESLENRRTEEAESLVRDHALALADHIERNVDYLD